MAGITVNMVAEIGKINLPMRDVLSLKPGDIVRLSNTNIEDPLVFTIGNRKKFHCRPGLLGNRVAVQITKVLEEIQQLDFEELTEEGED